MQRANVAVLVASLGLMACGEAPSTGLPNGGYNPDKGNVGGGDGDQGDGDGWNGGDGDGDSWSGGDGDGDGDGNVCQKKTLRNARAVPEVLIVLDRSGSMAGAGGGGGGNNRWTPSVNALKNATDELGEQIKFGLMAFPGTNTAYVPKQCGLFDLACHLENLAGGWASADECQPGSVAVDVGLNQSTEIEAALSAMRPNGGTPTAASLVEAGKYLSTTQAGPDVKQEPQYVLLVTDGEPNCGPGNTGASDLVRTVSEIEKLAQQDIKTFVIGYEIASRYAPGMDRMAVAGNTGATKHIPVQDEASLTKALAEITGQIASCTVVLDEPVDRPEYVLVTVGGRGIGLNQADGNGFSVASDRKTVTIQGTSCDRLRAASGAEVSVEVQCTPVVIQ